MALVLEGGRLIDGSGRDPVERSRVVVEGDRIAAVGAGGDHPRGAEVVGLDGLTVLPGLIDLHTHMGIVTIGELAGLPLAVVAAQLFRNAELCLLSGHTTAREVGGADGGLRQAIDQGLLPGPRLFPSGPLLSQSGGHGDLAPPFLALEHRHQGGVPGLVQPHATCDGPDEVRVAARTAFRHGATQIKMCVSGGVVSLTDRVEDAQFTVEELRAAVEEAQARDSYVTAHAHNVRGILNGLEAGVACFEHGTFLDERTAAKMAVARAALVPTLAVTQIFVEQAEAWGIPPSIVPRMAGVGEAMANAVKIAADAGVMVGSGTDILGPEQNRRGLELVLKAQILGPMAAIVSATATNARILRRETDLGTVEEGKLADLIAIDGDPLADPGVFDDPHRVVLVVKDGQVVKDTRSR